MSVYVCNVMNEQGDDSRQVNNGYGACPDGAGGHLPLPVINFDQYRQNGPHTHNNACSANNGPYAPCSDEHEDGDEAPLPLCALNFAPFVNKSHGPDNRTVQQNSGDYESDEEHLPLPVMNFKPYRKGQR